MTTTMYTVFGCLNTDDQPEIRVDEVEIPDAEITDAIHHVHVEFTTHGDDPQDAFLRVAALELQAAEDAYDRLFHAVKLILPWLWGGSVPTVRVELTANGDEVGRVDVPMDLVGWTRKMLPWSSERCDDMEALSLRGMVLR